MKILILSLLCLLILQTQQGCPFLSLSEDEEAGQRYVTQKEDVVQAVYLQDSGDDFEGLGFEERDPALKALNTHFISNYQDFLVPKKYSEILFTVGGSITLYRDGELVEKIRVPINMFHNMKAVAHLGLTVWVILNPSYDKNVLTDEQIDHLKDYLSQVKNVVLNKKIYVNEEQYNRQLMLLEEAKEFLTDVINNIQNYRDGSKNIKEDVEGYLERIMENTTKNIYDASMDQADSIIKATKQLKEKHLTANEWKKSKVVISQGHMAKPDTVYAQAFGYLFNIKDYNNPNERIIVLEQLKETDRLFTSGAHNIDYSIGDMWFKDRYRMHRDALADTTKDYISKMKPFEQEEEERDLDSGSSIYRFNIVMSFIVGICVFILL